MWAPADTPMRKETTSLVMRFSFLLLIVLGTLALFNPDKDDFAGFIGERAQTIVSDNVRASSGSLLGTGGGSVVAMLTRELARGSFERSNYFILSTYETDLNGAEHDGGEWKFLGVGGQFFELERPRMLGG